MALNADYFDYPHRSPGMDHDYYEWSMLADRAPVQWPGDAKLAVWINISLQFFPLNPNNKPFALPGGMTMPYPDLRHYSLRDYGNRVGIYRLFKALSNAGVTASAAINSRLAQRCPQLLQAVLEQGCEILCHGWDMDSPHYGGQDQAEEAALVEKSLRILRELSGQPVLGWLSPDKNESENTPALLAANGIEYFCDWVNDDMPYSFRTANGDLLALPLSTELQDTFIIQNNLHSEVSYTQQVCDAFDFLYQEASQQGGRMLALNIHPWLLGQPHRIGCFEAILAHLKNHSGIWFASPLDIARHFLNQGNQ